jgi:hypothetical protein
MHFGRQLRAAGLGSWFLRYSFFKIRAYPTLSHATVVKVAGCLVRMERPAHALAVVYALSR